MYEIKCGDKTFKVAELTLGDMAAFRDHIKARKVGLLKAVFAGTPEMVPAVKEALGRRIEDAEVEDAMREPESLVFLLHRSLHKNHPEITAPEVGDMMTVRGMAQEVPLIMAAMMGAGDPPKAPAAE